MDTNIRPLFAVMLILFSAVVVAYLLRATVLRRRLRELEGYWDLANEAGHGACALLMVPMVVPALMLNERVRCAAAIVSAVGGIFFLIRGLLVHAFKLIKLQKNDWWWDPVHAGMLLGMAVMYYTHDHLIINAKATEAVRWGTGAFYLVFTIYYAKELLFDWKEKHPFRRGLHIQSDLSHVVIFGTMFLMAFWPETFMAGCCCH